jgi:preprotein translocase subunit SecF
MIFGVLSLLTATLTLPGIIGVVLTIGIAVDSNVLIYERIREEVRTGRTPITAIDAGFTRALATILDSNITTFIAAAVLFFFGSGPVRGFAVTLGIGIVTTVFTAFTLTRLIVAWWVRWERPKQLAIISGQNVHCIALRCSFVPDDISSTSCLSASAPSAVLSIVAILLFFYGLISASTSQRR